MTLPPHTLRAGSYRPKRFSFNRWCHRIAALLQPEAVFDLRSIIIPQQVVIPDTSIYEGLIDVGMMISAGAAGVLPKASQGYWEDVQFQNTWRNARGRLPRGSYHFFDPQYSPTQQLNNYVSLLRADPGELPLVCDWEASWTGPYRNWSNLYAFLEGLKREIPGHLIYIYTGYYFWLDNSPNPITQPASLAYFAQYGLHLAWYADASIVRVPRPWTSLKWWQFTESGPGKQYGADSNSIDLSYYNGTPQQFREEYHLSTEPPADPVAYVVKRPLADYQLCLTPSTSDVLPLRTSLQQAMAFGWEAALHFGAGYTDTKLADGTPAGKVKGVSKANGIQYSNDPSFGYYIADDQTWIPFARRLIDQGAPNPNLDNIKLAPWCILGFDAANQVWLILTRGLEGAYGMTQMQAAEWCVAQGIREAYLGDSGHPADLAENGQTVYSPYGEGGPQSIGLQRKGVNVATEKGVCMAGKIANVKVQESGIGTDGKSYAAGYILRTLANTTADNAKGDAVYGDPTPTNSDILNVQKIYRYGGSVETLPITCKVNTANLTTFPNTPEPGTPPPTGGDQATVSVNFETKRAHIECTIGGVALKPKSIDAATGDVVLG